MYGRENFAMLMSGAAAKIGYNFEFFEGKFIIQPNYLMSYSFINTFDYKNSANVNITSQPLNAVQINPNIRIFGNLKNEWQPYFNIHMVWNLTDKSKFKANDTALPQLSIKPFVMYGVGVRKLWGEYFSGFSQTYVTNGGRNGVGLQFGFRWIIGHEN